MIEYPGIFWKDYELVDSGDGEKLERFGNYYMIRPIHVSARVPVSRRRARKTAVHGSV